MNDEQHAPQSRWLTGRTRLVTVASIMAVGLAGAAAVSANVGILDNASDSAVGNAAAVGDLTPTSQVVDVYLSDSSTVPAVPGTAVAPSAAGVQEFDVDVAGTVAIASTADGVRLERVTPADGWSWTLAQSEAASLMVTMTNGTRTLEFTASRAADGTVAASVNEPIVTLAPPVNPTTYGDDDDEYDDDEYDDDEYDDEHEEYEGRDDDD